MKILPILALFTCATFLSAAPAARADSATWNLNPTNGDWNTAANWTPMTVPNGATDTATFGSSGIPDVSLSADVEVDGITFEPGASAYTIATGDAFALTLSGVGIANNSGEVQNFSVETGPSNYGVIVFSNSASAGSNTNFSNQGGPFSSGVIVFSDGATAGSGTFTNLGSTIPFQIGGYLQFGDNSSAENAVLVNEGGTVDDATGGQIGFVGRATAANATLTNEAGPSNTTGNTGGGTIAFSPNSTAANATIINKGSTTNGGTGGRTFFGGGGGGSADAGDATLIAESGSNGGAGGNIIFLPPSRGGTSRIEVFGNGTFEGVNQSSLAIGSLEGDGIVLGSFTFKIGTNNLSTTFSGELEGSSKLFKVGRGTLTLSGANTYASGTEVDSGTLIISNTSGSGTGTGFVQVNGGILSGGGIIAGTVTIGTTSGSGARIAPAVDKFQENLTIQGALVLQSNAIYNCSFRAQGNRVRADRITARGVTINNGATLNLRGRTKGMLTPGLVIPIISNTLADPISGAFSNLADGAIVNVNGNNLQASYEGGDGNDLTLTVVP